MSHDWSPWLEQSEVTSNAVVRQPKRGRTLQCHKMIIQCAILTPPEQPTAPFASVHVQLQLGLDVRCAEFTQTASPEMPVYLLHYGFRFRAIFVIVPTTFPFSSLPQSCYTSCLPQI